MNLDMASMGLTGWLLFTAGFFVALTITALVWVGIGLVARVSPVPVRFLLWLVCIALLLWGGPAMYFGYLAVGVAGGFIGAMNFLGLMWGFLLFGFVRPEFSGHLRPDSEQTWPQRGLNGVLNVLIAPWETLHGMSSNVAPATQSE